MFLHKTNKLSVFADKRIFIRTNKIFTNKCIELDL